MKSPEKFEKDAIRKYLDSIGAWCFAPFMAGYGKTGVPDIICCYRGRFIGVEVKRPSKAPTPIQERRMAEIIDHGGIAVWGTADRVIERLKAIFPNA